MHNFLIYKIRKINKKKVSYLVPVAYIEKINKNKVSYLLNRKNK